MSPLCNYEMKYNENPNFHFQSHKSNNLKYQLDLQNKSEIGGGSSFNKSKSNDETKPALKRFKK